MIILAISKLTAFLSTHKKHIFGKHIVLVQNDNLNVSTADEEDTYKYLLISKAFQKLKISNVSILQGHDY
jgi:hypothetical protein